MIDNTDYRSARDAVLQQENISAADIPQGEQEEEILELTDVMKEIPEEKSEEIVDLGSYAREIDGQSKEAEGTGETASGDDIAGALGMSLNGKPESVESDFSIGTPLEDAITPEVLEDALERVIMRMFSEKIEPLLVEAVERGVQKEIERLRALILEDVPDARKP